MTLSKKICALAVCATLVLLQSCAKEELDLDKLNQFSEPKNITVSASLPQASNTSKTIIAFNDSGKVLWETTDAISVNGTTLSNISISPTDKRKATFSGEVSPLSETYYWGVYPTSIATAKNGDNYTTSGVKVNLPITQTYKGDTIPSFMVAYCSTSDDEVPLGFKNLCSIIKIPVQAASGVTGTSAQLKKIEVYALQDITGTATVSWNNGNPTITISGSKKITLDCGNTNVTTQKYFYIMIPAGTQTLIINFYDNNSKFMQKNLTSCVLTRSRIHTTNVVSLNATTSEPVFSVSNNTAVKFSPGNLQWSATGGNSTATTHVVAGGGTAAGTWRFAEHQYDYVGGGTNGTVFYHDGGTRTKCDNTNISSSYTGWIDLFGFGTSGSNNIHPYLSYTDPSYYPSTDISGSNYDWGKYNAIQEGSTTHPAGTWRTLTRAEWFYLCTTRNNSSDYSSVGKYLSGFGSLTLADNTTVVGLFILPDNYYTNSNSVAYTSQINWTMTELDLIKLGVVFLPASGNREGSSVHSAGSLGRYWSSTPNSSNGAYCLGFDSSGVVLQSSYNRYYGRAVRLVKDAN